MKVTSSARKYLIERGFDQKHGARPLRRTIEEYVEHPIAEGIIADKYKTGAIVTIDYKAKKLQISEAHEE